MAGINFNTGSLTHSIRFGYLKAEVGVRDATKSSGLPFSNYPLEILMGNTGMDTGSNFSAPAVLLQSNHQIKYDGSKALGPHIIRYGFDFNRIAAGGFVRDFSLAPLLFASVVPAEEAFAQTGPFTGGDTNQLAFAERTLIACATFQRLQIRFFGFTAKFVA